MTRPVPPPPRYGPPPADRPSGAAALLRRPWIPILAVVVVAGVVVAVVLAGGSDEKAPAAKTEAVSGTLHGALLARTPMSITFVGEAAQKPGGKGQFEGTVAILGDVRSGLPVPMIVTATERFDAGRLDLRFTGTLQCLSRDCAKRIVKGTGPIVRGTGDFAGAKGKLTIFAHADSATRGDFTLKGAIRY